MEIWTQWLVRVVLSRLIPMLINISSKRKHLWHSGVVEQQIQCVLYTFFTFANLAAPVFLHKFGTKKTLLTSIICFVIYSSNFLLIRNYVYFPCCAFAGVGLAFFFCGFGAYTAKHSTARTLSRTQSFSFMLTGSSMLLSGSFMILTSAIAKSPNAEIHVFRIGMIFVSVLALILCSLLPSRKIKGAIYQRDKTKTAGDQFKMVLRAMRNPGLLRLIPLYIFCGTFTCFMNSIYTTTVSFTESFADDRDLVAFVCMSMSIGELSVGLAMGYLNRKAAATGFFYYASSICTVYILMGLLAGLLMLAKMNDDRFMAMAAILLGIVQLLGFYGFDMMAFLVEPVCHSVRERCPDCIIEYAGYYGVAILCFSYTIGNLIAPCLLPIFGSQGCLTLSALCFASYAANFLYLRNYFYFPACVLGGWGFAFFYAGGGSYALRHSTDRTLSRNQSITWMVGSVTTLLSGIFQIVTNTVLDEIPDENITTLAYENQAAYRDFSDLEIRILSTGMTFIFLTLYPTTLAFTDSLAGEKNTVAYYCIAVTIGEVIVGLIITTLNKRVKDFGMVPALSITTALTATVAALMIAFTPALSSLAPTKEISLFEPSATVAIILGILCGALDGAANNCRMVSAAKSLPADPAIGFSVSKFYQAIGQTTCLYLGAMFNMHQMILLSASMLIAGIFGYILFLRGLSNRKVSTQKIPH
ncbi:unnamed protein product, partial [Mesorhabditis spiculigera]